MIIRSLERKDWPQVRSIYELGIATGIATFENQAPGWEQWDASHTPFARFVAEEQQQVAGWIALSPVSSRFVYHGVAEVSVYVHPNYSRKGVGSSLLKAAIAESEAKGIWTLNAAMFPENVGSRKLHQKMGFREIGYREKIAKKNGEWKDNVIMERRSRVDQFL